MGSHELRATDPPGAGPAAGVAVVSLLALGAVNVLGALHLLDITYFLRGSRSIIWIENGVTLLAIVAYLYWLYRRHKSLPWVDAVPDEGPVLAVVWHLIPVVNLVKPYFTLCEMWDSTASEESTPSRMRGPVGYFWGTFVVAIVLFNVSPFAQRSMGPAGESYFLTLARLVLAVSTGFAAAMILAIDARWKARYVAVSQRYDAMPDAPIEDYGASQLPAAAPMHSDAKPPAPVAPASGRVVTAPPSRPAPPAAASPPPVTRDAGVPPHVPASPAPPAATPPPRPAPPSPAALNVLAKLRGAGKAAAILSVFTMLYIVMMFASGLNQMSTFISGDAFGEAIARTVVLVYAAVGAFAAIPGIHLWRFSRAAKVFAGDPTEANLNDALRFQGRYWAFIGGSVAIVLVLELLMIGLAILVPFIIMAVRS